MDKKDLDAIVRDTIENGEVVAGIRSEKHGSRALYFKSGVTPESDTVVFVNSTFPEHSTVYRPFGGLRKIMQIIREEGI